MFRGSGGGSGPQNYHALKAFRRFLPVTEDSRGDRFFVREYGKRYATPLLAVLVVIESTDVIFAIDSLPAVLSITSNTFVAYSSIVFAVLGLRALYFALEGLVDCFTYLHYGLAAILVILGAEFLLQGFGVHVPTYVFSLLVIAAIIAVSVVVSPIATRGGGSGGGAARGQVGAGS